MLELTVTSGSSTGQRQRFEQERVTIGRHPSSSFRFDAERELDVSAHHAEVRNVDGRWLLTDSGSTNGTYVNGRRAEGDVALHDGDLIALGPHGPQVTVRLGVASRPETGVPSTRVSSAVGVASPSVATSPAFAERARKRGGVALAGGGVAVVAALAAGVWWLASGAPGEPAAIAQTGTAATASGTSTGATPAVFEVVSQRNGRAVAFIASELHGKPFGGTAFGVTPRGLMVTNRHLVADGGTRATRLMVKFADTPAWLPAHVVAVADGDDDLALVQVDVEGSYPTVVGIAAAPDPRVGAPVATIGFPLGTDLPMDGTGEEAIARSTLTGGTVSKRLATLLQLDSFAGHGSSGSPVFDASGLVVGVVWGGPRESGGRIVYAIPSDRVVALLPPEARAVVR